MATYLAIDVGGTFVKYAEVNHSGKLMEVRKVPTPKNLVSFLDILDKIISTFLDCKLKGIGISCPGKVQMDTGTIYFGGSLSYLHELSLKKYIENKYKVYCTVSNDGKAAALAEVWMGNLKGINNGAAIVLGTGLGGGIVVNGSLLQGDHFQAGELSFMMDSLDHASLKNMLGFQLSAVKFVEEASQILGLKECDGQEVFMYIVQKKGNALQELFEDYCKKIAGLIYNLQTILDLSVVVIGGGISVQNILIETIKAEYLKIKEHNHIISDTLSSVEIRAYAFNNDSNLLGAVYQLLLQMEERGKEING